MMTCSPNFSVYHFVLASMSWTETAKNAPLTAEKGGAGVGAGWPGTSRATMSESAHASMTPPFFPETVPTSTGQRIADQEGPSHVIIVGLYWLPEVRPRRISLGTF